MTKEVDQSNEKKKKFFLKQVFADHQVNKLSVLSSLHIINCEIKILIDDHHALTFHPPFFFFFFLCLGNCAKKKEADDEEDRLFKVTQSKGSRKKKKKNNDGIDLLKSSTISRRQIFSLNTESNNCFLFIRV